MKIKEFANQVVHAFNNQNIEALDNVAHEIKIYLIEDFSEIKSFQKDIDGFKDFKYCSAAIEYTFLHQGKEQGLCFVINETCSISPELSLLSKRIFLLDIPNRVGNIEMEWKKSVETAIYKIKELIDLDYDILSKSGNIFFLERSVKKVFSQYSEMLKQINGHIELVPFIANFITKSCDFSPEEIRFILSMTSGNNENHIPRNLLNY